MEPLLLWLLLRSSKSIKVSRWTSLSSTLILLTRTAFCASASSGAKGCIDAWACSELALLFGLNCKGLGTGVKSWPHPPSVVPGQPAPPNLSGSVGPPGDLARNVGGKVRELAVRSAVEQASSGER